MPHLCSTGFANPDPPFGCYMLPCRSDYLFTLDLEGLGASGRLAVLAFAIVVEPSL